MNKQKLILIVAGVLVLVAGGYFYNRYNQYVVEKAADEFVEKMIEKETGNNVEIDSDDETFKVESDKGSLEVGDNQSWPDTIPSEVPQLSSGVINYSASNNEDGQRGWQVLYAEVSSSEPDSYKTALEANGWTIKDSIQIAGATSFSALQGNSAITVSFNTSDQTAQMIIFYKD